MTVFRYSRKVHIPGTEDMEREYRDPIHHIIGFAKSIPIGVVVSGISAGFVSLVTTIPTI